MLFRCDFLSLYLCWCIFFLRPKICRQSLKGKIIISICDTGPGIPEDALQKVFDPFFRLEGSRANHTGGTELGLGIAHNIARAHGSELVLQNKPEGSLCAILNLPK
ncbi:ATP-binding protein [Solemya elarraichensis gill symbiont]|uniref:histidine kinase n=1 Tax=Solemya elarraichensis gill symbiont TaxID=1918949 RepID=A0A1T2KYZ7_9GAMM|nr:ATP-binding protein [Solemya elarraichensis gill symbiont]OOZ38014.1 hypothetical protein BOW52_09600 [Solemya elarraichensis gill symbiont]